MLANSIKYPDREGLAAKKPADTCVVFSFEAELQLITQLEYEKRRGQQRISETFYIFIPLTEVSLSYAKCQLVLVCHVLSTSDS